MIDNQQVKYKISIIFRIADRLPFLFPVLCGLGGGWSKNGSPAGPISGRWSVPHIILPEYPAYHPPRISRVSSSPNVPRIILPEDQIGITNYDKVDGSNDFGFLRPERDSYKGTPYLPDDVSSWTNGALSDWDGKANSNVLKGVTTGGGSYTSYATAGHVLNTFLASADAKGYDGWYIPSCGQLSLIYMYLISVNNALLAIGGQPLDTRYYRSSSEHSSNSGWIVLFNNGRAFTRYKRLTSSVRFVRDIE